MESVTSADGTRIAYQRTGSGPPLILVHGTASDHSRWEPLAEHLRDNFTLYALDRRGRGGSSDGVTYSMELEYADIAAVANSIGRPVNIYGHSYGVHCVLGAAPMIENLNRLVLYEGPFANGTEITPTPFIEEMEQLIANGKSDQAISKFMREILKMSEEDLEKYRSMPSWQARIEAAPSVPRELRAANGYTFNPDLARRIRVPTLLLVGGESLEFFTRSVQELDEALPDSRVHRLDGQMHSADAAAPELVADALKNFLLDH